MKKVRTDDGRLAPLGHAGAARVRRRWPKVLFGIVIPVLLLTVAFFVVDAGVRSYAEGRVRDEIQQNLPAGVTGAVTVHIGGASVIAQYLAGSFERVEVDAPALTINGIPVAASVVAAGVPADLTKPVASASGTLRVDQAALNQLVRVPGATGGVTLGQGTLTYDGTTTLAGFRIGYQVAATPKANGATVLLQPKDAKVTAGGGGIDLTAPLVAALGQTPVAVCVAQYLPVGFAVTAVDVTPMSATITVNAQNVVLSRATLGTRGSCS
jgi:hypothetical protein